jgi:hypothetical protein
MTPHAERTIAVGEKDYSGFWFRDDDLAGGVTVSSGAAAVLPAAGLTLLTAVLLTTAHDGAYVWWTAVTAGTYDITFTITFSDNKILKRVYRIRIE